MMEKLWTSIFCASRNVLKLTNPNKLSATFPLTRVMSKDMAGRRRKRKNITHI